MATSSQRELQKAYKSLIFGNEQVKEDLKETFKTVRILAVGKSGSGKSTLIRLLMGDHGPRTIKQGSSAEQDIRTEWRHPDPDLPLIIHDSNGIDTQGETRMADIRQFLSGCQSNLNINEFSKRVHAVWYVFSAVDNRVTDDGGLLRMLDAYEGLPLLLIMTHNDIVKESGGKLQKNSKARLQQLLESIGDSEKQRKLRESLIVRVGNRIKVDKRGEIRKVNVDEEALKEVIEKTKQLMDKELWMTWAACQAVDTKAKVEASVKLLIQRRNQQAFLTIPLHIIPIAHQKQMNLMFVSVTKALAKIWKTSENLQKAIIDGVEKQEQRMKTVTSDTDLWSNIKPVLKLIVGTIMLFNPIAAEMLRSFIRGLNSTTASNRALVAVSESPPEFSQLPALTTQEYIYIAAQIGAGMRVATNEGNKTSKILTSYGLLVIGVAMYAHVHDVTGKGSVDDYQRLLQDFLSSDWPREISEFSEALSPSIITNLIFGNDAQREHLSSKIVDFFVKLCRARREDDDNVNSLVSLSLY